MTSEFGPLGSLVFDKTKPESTCKILLTRWESRKIKSGDRLYLVGRLANLNEDQPQGHSIGTKRLDHQLERLRMTEPPDRPLVYFK